MKLVSVKTADAIKLTGITVELEIVDNSTKSATLTDADGNMVQFAIDSYNFKVYVKAPPVRVKKYHLHGEVLGLSVDETFDAEHEAMHRRNQLCSGMHNEPELTITEVEVEVAA